MLRTRANSPSVVTERFFWWRLTAKWIGVVVLLLAVAGCAGRSKYMQDVPEGQADYVPEPGRTLVIFMRPSGFGFAIQSSVFDITDGEPEFLGIVSAKTKIAHNADPGEHRYMVIGENASFLEADLLADRTYYSLVTPRMGVWKARFSLKPVHKFDLTSAEFTQWYDGTRWVENTPSSLTWAQEHMDGIKRKQEKYLPEWLIRTDKRALLPNDGRQLAPPIE